jgi:hypothetical protein
MTDRSVARSKAVPKETHESHSFHYYSDNRVLQEYECPKLGRPGQTRQQNWFGKLCPRRYLHSSKEADGPPELLFPTEEIESLGWTDNQRKTRNEEDLHFHKERKPI